MAIYHEASPLKMTTSGATLAAGEAQPDAVFAAGTRATLTTYPGTNEITNGDIGVGTGWTAGTNWSASGNKAVKASSTATATYAHNTFAATVGPTVLQQSAAHEELY